METINQIVGYFFGPFPGRAFAYYPHIIVLIVGILAFSLYLRLRIRKDKEDKTFRRLFRNFPGKLEITATALAVYILLRYYNIGFFSMRMMIYLILATTLILGYYIVITYVKKYPAAKKLRQNQMEKNKYLPRKKKRR